MPNSYPLESLLTVRLHREEVAKTNVTRAQALLKASQLLVEQREKELDEWRIWRVKEIDRRYLTILGKKLNIEKITDFNQGLSKLAEDELIKIAGIDQAKRQVIQNETDLKKAKDIVVQSRKNAAKIEAHKDMWLTDEKKEQERLADLELEDFRPVRRKGVVSEDDDVFK